MTIETAAEKLCPAVRSITFNEKFLGFAVCLNLLQYSQTSEHWLDFRTKSRTVGSSWSWVPNHSERANWHKCLIIWVDILKTGELPDVQKKKILKKSTLVNCEEYAWITQHRLYKPLHMFYCIAKEQSEHLFCSAPWAAHTEKHWCDLET